MPQVHDWFIGLLLPGQWFALWLTLGVLIVIAGAVLAIRTDESGFFIGGLYVFIPGLPIFWVILVGLGHFISFMIYLWSGAPVG